MKRMPLLLSAWLLAASPPGPAAAATAAPGDTLRLTMDDAVAHALQHGPDARAARAGVAAAEGRVREARADALPQITGTLTYGRQFDSIFENAARDSAAGALGSLLARTPFAAENRWAADLTATQMLWSGGRIGAGLSAAKARRDATAADRDEALAALALEVRAAYLQALYTRELVAIARNSLTQSREHLDHVVKFRGQGARSEYDLLQARVDVANQEPALVSARNAADQALLELRHLLAVPLGQPLVLSTPLAFEPGRVPRLADEPADGTARPAIRGADANVLAWKHSLRAEKAARRPTLSASTTLSHQAFPDDAWSVSRRQFVRALDAEVKLEWPVFQGFRTAGAVQRANAELARAEAEREQARTGVALEVEEARNEVARALSTLAARRGTVQLAASTHRLATVRWQNGIATQLEVSDARRQLQTAETNEVEALKGYRFALLQLERVTGAPLSITYSALDDLPAADPGRDVD